MPAITRDIAAHARSLCQGAQRFSRAGARAQEAATVHLGEHVTLLFEDELTIRYQIQEMLRIEKTFEEAGIDDELEAYSPLVPDGIELQGDDADRVRGRRRAQARARRLRGIEARVYVQVEGCARVYAIADEDLPRENDEKTAAVHFLRFELTPEMVAALKYGGGLGIGVDHPEYAAAILAVDEATRVALLADLA